ncbi:MAG: hypothetical protein OEZ14_08515 [Acidimicrobiia bacterium]|nr:hypothetical protein [Acidimicrobiia bacterium]MDH5520561.1 hypothetical protein [Acidimicrobiia bacterium]
MTTDAERQHLQGTMDRLRRHVLTVVDGLDDRQRRTSTDAGGKSTLVVGP